jgi:hypothetical protein
VTPRDSTASPSLLRSRVASRSRLSDYALVALLGLSVAGLAGCGPKRMRADFIGFEKQYAETSNREVLLNLARLEAHDTTYFFKLGQISSQYKTAATLSGTGSYVLQGNTGTNAIGGGGPGLTFENDPSFSFVPVNDAESAQLLLKPVPALTMYNLYQQGWRIDQLFRLLVDRIEITVPTGATTCSVKTYRNVPPPARSKQDMSADSDYLKDASSYATFLRVSAAVYGLQRHGHLLLKGTTDFVPLDPESGVAADAEKADTFSPKTTDIASAATKNQSWRYVNKHWILEQQVFGAQFYLNDQETILDDFKNDPRLAGLDVGQSLNDVLQTLKSGFSIEEPAQGGGDTDTCKESIKAKTSTAHLVMRSLIGLMAAVAQEQGPFQALMDYPEQLPKADPRDDRQMKFSEAIPPIERLPALRLKWTSGQKDGPALVEVNYRGTNYQIADANSPQIPDNQYWNRDMFRLINQITAQVTVDISKFPLPGILRISAD